MLACSIVIRAYNEENHIGRLLTGISQQSLGNVQIILVDSGSSDATLAIASRFPVEIVQIRPEDFTFGRSLNDGIRQAKAELIVIASAHVYPVYPDWLQRLLEPFDDSQVGLVYGKQRGNASTKFSEHQIFARWFPEQPQTRQPHPFCNNANAAIRRRLWEEHAYDETLPGLEDLEWARWVMEQGYCIAYVPQAEIIHVHEERPRGIYNRYRREAMAFKHIFPQESFNLMDFLRLFLSNTASDAWHASRKGLLWASFGSILWFRFMQFWGTYQGFRHYGPLTWHLRQTFYYPHGLQQAQELQSRTIAPIHYEDLG